ncbi:MAG: hypothetical protein PWP38_1955 [Clostridiales bacterium]|nr:hypothetical protein [Clostridiales bacterium]
MKHHPIIEQLINAAPLINELTIKDTAIAVTDRTHYLSYIPGKQLDHRVSVGAPLKSGSLVDLAMKAREKKYAIVDASMFGIPYVGAAIPIIDPETDDVIGSLFIGESTEKQELLKSMAKELSDNISEVNAFTHEIYSKSDKFSSLAHQLADVTDAFNKKIKEIESVSSVINTIARQSNMLGINAAIESARLGELGRGFAVVAEEISNLSKRSHESTANITEMTKSILSDSQVIEDETNTISGLSKEITTILSELTHSIDSIYGMVEELQSLSEQV